MQKPKITRIQSDFALLVPPIHRLPEFMRFVQWFATPRQFREPRTQKELAETVGVCEDTLTDWKRHPQFWPLVRQAINMWIKDRIPDVIGGLYLRASSEKTSARETEMFLRFAGMETGKNKKK